MNTPEIRRNFLEFFAERSHTVVQSSSLIPDDPTLLLTNAGMVQFKPYFLGEREPPYKRATSVQKCFRTVDLEIVGTTSRHFTFFEMLGNFSFGDYFKQDACIWAWELMTQTYALEPERLVATVFETDDEAASIWEREVGVPAARILRMGRKGNYWDMGVAGPCGPASELLYDRGDDFGAPYSPGKPLDDERYLEIYNLVFMQDIQDDEGNLVGKLPNQNVDTGLGLARLAAVLQEVRTSFEVDSVAPILEQASSQVGTPYGKDAKIDVSLRVLAEHARAMTFLVGDGVIPSNEQRGYVLRRLIRRAVRHARLVGVDDPVLLPLVEVSIELFKDAYPELGRNAERIRKVIDQEEQKFDATLTQALGILEDELQHLKAAGDSQLSGDVAFKLHDTYGFPLDLTLEIAAEEGVAVDTEGFDRDMKEQRTRARASTHRKTGDEAGGLVVDPSEFVGYEKLGTDSKVALAIRDGKPVPALAEGDRGELILPVTPFYAESGGQVGDRGVLKTQTGTFRVEDTQKATNGAIVHSGEVASGEVRIGQELSAEVDTEHRAGVQRSHTATHILHWVLRETLGEHATQQGSLVEPGRLRFDFSHFDSVTSEQLAEMEETLNHLVLTDDSVRAFETSYDYAMSLGAMALFGEKYSDYVRVVEVGEYSKELCGGTHVPRTGHIGVIKLMGESSIGAGTRRVEALTGMEGLRYLNDAVGRLERLSSKLKVEPDLIEDRIDKLLQSAKEMESELAGRRKSAQSDEATEILGREDFEQVGESRLISVRRDGRGVPDIKELIKKLIGGSGQAVVIVASSSGKSANIVVGVAPALLEKGIAAVDLIKEGGAKLGGGAGGDGSSAVAGGPDISQIDAAVTAIEDRTRSSLGSIT